MSIRHRIIRALGGVVPGSRVVYLDRDTVSVNPVGALALFRRCYREGMLSREEREELEAQLFAYLRMLADLTPSEDGAA